MAIKEVKPQSLLWYISQHLGDHRTFDVFFLRITIDILSSKERLSTRKTQWLPTLHIQISSHKQSSIASVLNPSLTLCLFLRREVTSLAPYIKISH